MESNLQQRRRVLHTHQQPTTTNPGLTRFRSAPSSFFESLLESCEEFLNRPSSPETERMMTRLISDDISDDNIADAFPAPNNNQQTLFTRNIKSETEVLQTNGNNNISYCSVSSLNYCQNSSQPPSLPNRTIRGGGGVGSALIRQSSSPAGLFSDMNIDNGHGGAAMGNLNFSSPRIASSMVQMSPIAETRVKASKLVHDDDFGADFPIGSWDRDMAENYRPLKRARDEDQNTLSGPNSYEVQSGVFATRPPIFAHHLSLPKTSSGIDKFLQLQDSDSDSVPWRIRAKRGCATHPRSIAERVRRTRISERMRKLQDLVPNMDKQTNTSDMLDLAVDHIKDLQNQVKMLSASRTSCRCMSKNQL